MYGKFQGWQIASSAISLSHLAPDVLARFQAIETQIANLDETFSTDAERIAAVAAIVQSLTELQNVDANLYTTINQLAGKLRTAIGTDANGDYVVDAEGNYIAGATSVHSATVLLDDALKAVADALTAETTRATQAEVALQQQLTTLQNNVADATRSNIKGLDLVPNELADVVDAATGIIEVDKDIALLSFVQVNGQLLKAADVEAVDGQAKQLKLLGLPVEAFAAPISVQYYFRTAA